MTAHWAFQRGKFETLEVYVVDEHGCQLNTEPVMSILAAWHPWFVEWLKQQPCTYPELGGLMFHPALGETHAARLVGFGGVRDDGVSVNRIEGELCHRLPG